MKQGRLALETGHVSYSIGGSGPALVMLHGFPQTRAMWAPYCEALMADYTVITPDLRGYGESRGPAGAAHHSFRAMGRDIRALMDHLGHARFRLVGHDRGARVAHRMCLDAPERISRVCLMDIVPTHTLLSELQQAVAKAYYHWFFLAQPAPFPETMIGHDPDAYFQSCLLGWGGSTLGDFDAVRLEAYRAAWRNPEVIAGMCDDYRAGLSHDMADDSADPGARIACSALVLYGADGVMAQTYDVGGTWASKCERLRTQAVPGGHFFPDTHTSETLAALEPFLRGE